MVFLTEDAKLICVHRGVVDIAPTQPFVRIKGRLVLVDDNPEKRSIARCPMLPPSHKTCTQTKEVEKGYSDWIRIAGKRVCLRSVTGLTNGAPPVNYLVQSPGQDWVEDLADG